MRSVDGQEGGGPVYRRVG